MRHVITGFAARVRGVRVRSRPGRSLAPVADSRAVADRRERPHLIYLAIGFPPAAKSSAYRMRETANQFCKAGWDVTVVNIAQESWERDSGVDLTLLEQVDPRVKIVELPLSREDLETDIRLYGEERALQPSTSGSRSCASGSRSHVPRARTSASGAAALEQAVLDIHQEHPADLLVASCVPYVNLAAAWKLWEEARVPYAVDFRDGWSIDVITGASRPSPRTPELGHWEQKVLGEATRSRCGS